MGKKDEEIVKLNDELAKLLAKNKGLTENNQQLNEQIADMKANFKERLEQIQKDSQEAIKLIRKEFEHLENIKTPLDLEVDVTGCQDIPKTLDDAVKLMESRFEDLGLGGKYNIIAHPHTMKLKIL